MPDLRNRAQLERQFAYGVSLALNRQRSRLVAYGVEKLGDRPESEWRRDEEELAAALVFLLRQPWYEAQGGLASQFGVIRPQAAIGPDFERWVVEYARKTAADITATNREKALAAAAALVVLSPKLGEPYQPTREQINKTFGAASLASIVDPRRISNIAITEVTRGISAGEQAAAAAIEATALAAGVVGLKVRPFSITERDGLVCPVCRAKDGRPIVDEFPPFHPSCRCWVDWRLG